MRSLCIFSDAKWRLRWIIANIHHWRIIINSPNEITNDIKANDLASVSLNEKCPLYFQFIHSLNIRLCYSNLGGTTRESKPFYYSNDLGGLRLQNLLYVYRIFIRKWLVTHSLLLRWSRTTLPLSITLNRLFHTNFDRQIPNVKLFINWFFLFNFSFYLQ